MKKIVWVIVGVGTIAVLSSWMLFERLATNDEQTFNFACGFRYGQNAVMRKLPSELLKPDEIVPVMKECEPYRKHASEHGFVGALDGR